MRCKDLQNELALYVDKALDEDQAILLEVHLQKCPVCRQELSELTELRLKLRKLTEPSVPASFVLQVRRNTVLELQAPVKNRELSRWLQFRIMPYFVGFATSAVIFILFLISLFSTNTMEKSDFSIAYNKTFKSSYINRDESVIRYTSSRLSIASEPPSINPEGSLVSFSRSFVNKRLNRGEVVIVADVFSNGMARIFEVVQPTQDKEIIQALQKALEEDSDETAFLPANLDKRSDITRVVLRIQGVEVIDKAPR